ncbi:MAG: MBG domain-containing protein [Thermoguttaceae bacterium]
MENRILLDAAAVCEPILSHPIQAGGSGVTPAVSPPGFSPSQVLTAYGIGSISLGGVAGTGSGQTVAIVDAYNDPKITSDVTAFNSQFNLPQFNSGGPTFTVLGETGTSALPSNAPTGSSGWGTEESLDVEWVHSVAPQANIILFEANSASMSDLLHTVQTAATHSGVSVVSMSWGGSESRDESSDDSYFTAANVAFVAATGDEGAPGDYPAFSPNVIAVGGTTLTVNSNNNWQSETAWSDGGGGQSQSQGQGWGHGGGGTTYDEPEPSYQELAVDPAQTSGARETPDVSFDADPNTGVPIYDSYDFPSSPWQEYGGTSFSCQCWAGLIAIADQYRSTAGLSPLCSNKSNGGDYSAQTALYSLPSAAFHDITTGSNGNAAKVGYDMATGIGTPIANLLVPDLAAAATSTTLAASAASSVYGQPVTFTATVAAATTGGATPTGGTVTFMDGTTTLGSATLSSGTATLTTTLLPIGTQQVTATYNGVIATQNGTGTNNFAGSPGNTKSVAVTPAPLTVTANNQSRTYGAADPTLTAGYSGFVNGQTLATSGVSGSPSLTGSDTVGSPAGSYVITAAQGTLAAQNYSFIFVNGTLTVTPAPLTVTANNQSRTYGAADPTLTAGYSGFVNGQTLATSGVSGSPSLTGGDTAGSPVGSYVITAAQGTLAAQNYSFTFVNGTLTVTPAPLTVRADNQSMVYGAALPALTAGYSGFVSGDTPANLSTQPTLSTAATVGSPVSGSPYTITASGAVDPDYTISYVAGRLTVMPATPIVAVSDAGGTYSGQPFPATATVAGVLSGVDTTPAASLEGVTPTLAYYAGTTTDGTALGGAPAALGTYTVVALFAGSGDYASAQSDPLTFNIGQATPAVTVADSGGTYSGQPFPATATVAGVVSGVDTTPAASLEGVTPTLAYYAGATADGTALGGVPTDAGTYTVVALFAGSGDYASAQSDPLTFSIGQATPTVTAADLGGTYSGSAFPATATVAGVAGDVSPAASLDGDTPALAYYDASGTLLTGAPTDAGTYTVVATFAGSGDYASAQSDPLTFTIGPATPTVTVAQGGGTYSGQPLPATATVAGVVNGVDTTPAPSLEGVTPTLAYYDASGTLLAGAPTDVGTYIVVASFAGSADYASAQSTPATLSVTPQVITVDSAQTVDSLETSGNVQVTVASGGQLTVNSPVVLDSGGGVSVSDGGMLAVPGINSAADAVGLDLDGGTLQATADFTTAAPVTAGAGGATIDSNGNDVTLTAAIAGPGGVTLIGAGTVTFSGVNTYGGPTAVQSGTLVAMSSQAIPSGGALNIGSDGSIVLGEPGTSEAPMAAQAVPGGAMQAALASAGQDGTGTASLVASGPSVTPAGGGTSATVASDSVLAAAAPAPTATVAPAAVDHLLAIQPVSESNPAAQVLRSSSVILPLSSLLLPASPVPPSDAAVPDHAGDRPAGDATPRVAAPRTAASRQPSDGVLPRIVEGRAGNAASRAGNQHPATGPFGLDLQTLDLLARAAARRP